MAKKVEDEMESASLGGAVSFQELGGPSRGPHNKDHWGPLSNGNYHM